LRDQRKNLKVTNKYRITAGLMVKTDFITSIADWTSPGISDYVGRVLQN